MKEGARVVVYGNAMIVVVIAIYFFAVPAGLVVQTLNDPGLRTGKFHGLRFAGITRYRSDLSLGLAIGLLPVVPRN
jgi:hypothetical protein